jgi:hypothetical protein
MDISGKSSKEESDLDRLKLDLDREKMKIEQENFNRQQRTEILKAIITAISIIVPVYIAYITLNYNLQIEESKADQSQKLLEESTRSNFLLKATEIVMNAKTINETKNRAYAMKILFPNNLPEDFADSFLSFEAGNNPYEGDVFYGDVSIQKDNNSLINLSQKVKIYTNILDHIRKSDARIEDSNYFIIDSKKISNGIRINDSNNIIIKNLTIRRDIGSNITTSFIYFNLSK